MTSLMKNSKKLTMTVWCSRNCFKLRELSWLALLLLIIDLRTMRA